MKTYLLKLTKDERKFMEGALELHIDLCQDSIHDNIYFKDEERVEEGKEELKKLMGVMEKIKKAKAI